jgi:hypothetical protein
MVRSFACLLSIAAVAAAVEPGATLPGPFSAFIVTGGPRPPATEPVQTEERQNFADPSRAGKNSDLVTRFGLNPTVAVFTREAPPTDDSPLGQLIKQLNGDVERFRNQRLQGFVVFLRLNDEFLDDNDRIPHIRAVEAFAGKAEIRTIPLALDQARSARTEQWKIGADDVTTVVLYENHRVKAKFTFTADKPLDDAGLKAVQAAVRQMLKVK